ncbi:MAG: exonuclease domain-containing protein [Coriobacteriia bacterium]|nr:exonuclease domain-containing protein [Coriobacteriia bacterium]
MESRSVIASEYVVLDVETNGLSSLGDDLLSISVFQPDTGKIFNRFLPLELNPDVYTTHINGIKKEDLKGATPLTQEDVDDLIVEFDLENRTILTYGTLDEKFIRNYLKRKKLDGFQKLRFFNFKRNVMSSRYSRGNVSKDNLCNIYGIGNVQGEHTGVNDCLLEWELFKEMDNKKLLVTHDDVYEFNEEYVIPISYLTTYPNCKYHIPNLPNVSCSAEEIKRFEIVHENLKKFPTNFNGLVIEHLINSMLSVEEVESLSYLVENKRKLKYLGKLPSIYEDVLLNFKPDGTVSAVFEKDKKAEEELNRFVLILKQDISPLITYIAQDIFCGERIYSQELVVHQDVNVLALCDLSSNSAVLEIKTCESLEVGLFGEQLYYQAKGRPCYVLQVDWSQTPEKIGFIVSKVELTISERREESRADKYYRKVIDRSNGTVTASGYFGSRDNVTAKCSHFDHEWTIKADQLLARPYCPECKRKQKEDLKSENAPKPPMTAKEREELRVQNYRLKINEKSKGGISIVEYHGSKERAIARCSRCGSEWSARADHLLQKPYCRACRRS